MLTTHEDTLENLYGLRQSRNPRLLIVIGNASQLPEDRARVLQQLNLSLHRVEIVPYDVIGERAKGWLANLEHYLALRLDSSDPPSDENDAQTSTTSG